MLVDLADDLAATGWEVRVIASQALYADDGGALPPRETRNGVAIHRVRATRLARFSLVGRALDYLTFILGAFFAALRGPRPDLVVAMTDPPVMVQVAALVAILRGARLVFWVQDLYPELAAALGVFRRDSLPYRLLAAGERWARRRADAVLVQGPRMARAVVAGGADAEKVRVCANWADVHALTPPLPEANLFAPAHDLAGRFVVLYSGNAGRAHTFEAILSAAELLKGDDQVRFLFIGGGPQMGYIRAEVERRQLTNTRLLPYEPREMLAHSLASANVSLVTEKPEAAGLLLASKTFGILASARPLLFIGDADSDVADVVREAGAGLVLAPDDPAALVAAIRRLQGDPAHAAQLGASGRKAALARHDRRVATARWAQLVRELTHV
jgi:glycosyltransferase involved in cell wall biosynthesis